jgi:hypothetical protein
MSSCIFPRTTQLLLVLVNVVLLLMQLNIVNVKSFVIRPPWEMASTFLVPERLSISSSPSSLILSGSEESLSTVYFNDFLPRPNADYTGLGVVEACMDSFVQDKVHGLEVSFAFSSDRCRAAIGGSLDRFQEYANNPVFSYLINCIDYQILNVGPIIPGTSHRGPMQTCLLVAIQDKDGPGPTKGNDNIDPSELLTTSKQCRFLWTLQQERRPPLEGCWMIHEVLYVKNAWQQTL